MEAFETFYRDHIKLVYGVAIAREGDPSRAEDLTQDTFFRAWRQYSRLATLPPPAQRAWLVRTVRNLAIDHWRVARHAVFVPPPGDAPDRPLADRIALQLDVTQALSTLAEEDRQIIVFRYYLEMNSREIGELLQIPEGTVRSRLKQCRTRLMRQLASWNPGKTEKADA